MSKHEKPAWQRTIDEGRYWDEDEAREALAAWRQSGMSLRAFAHHHGTTEQRFSRWRLPPTLMPVWVREGGARRASGAAFALEVGVARIEVFDAERVGHDTLVALVRALAAVGA